MPSLPMDPFLLPMCPACGGPTSLSQIEPFWSGEVEDLRTYQCPRCDKSESIPVRRHRCPGPTVTLPGSAGSPWRNVGLGGPLPRRRFGEFRPL